MKYLYLIGLLFLSSNAYASNWVIVDNNPDFAINYIDVSSITLMNDGSYQFWTKVLYKNDFKVKNTKVWYTLNLESVKCIDKTMEILETTGYDLKREVIATQGSIYPEIIHIPPDSVAETTSKFVCTIKNTLNPDQNKQP